MLYFESLYSFALRCQSRWSGDTFSRTATAGCSDSVRISGEQIREGWLRHIETGEPNFLWVSNERALKLMADGMVPPATSEPANNEHFDQIDAQLTTEIFGLFAPTRPDVAVQLAQQSAEVELRSLTITGGSTSGLAGEHGGGISVHGGGDFGGGARLTARRYRLSFWLEGRGAGIGARTTAS